MKPALFVGGMYPFRALSLLRRTPRLWRNIWIPLVVNAVVGVTVYVGLLLAGLRGIDAFVAWLPAWAAFLGVLLRVLLIIMLLIAVGFLLLQFGVVLGSPWYSRLSEQIEQMMAGEVPLIGESGVAGWGREIGRALSFEIKKLLLMAVVGLPLLLLNFVPVAGPVLASAGGIVLATVIVCLDFFDPTLERRRLSFRAKLAVIRRSLPASAGFGLVCLGLVSIPLLNLLAIPLCVAAGTLFFCDYVRPDLEKPIKKRP